VSLRVYIAGPMSGVPLFNHPAFDDAAERLRAQGHSVWSPAELDRLMGIDPAHSISEDQRRRLLGAGIRALTECQAIALLPGWECSVGATLEKDIAAALGMDVFHLPDVRASSEDDGA